MADIRHDFPIQASRERVFEAVSSPAGLDQWWTKRAAGDPRVGAEYELWFGPAYDWRAVLNKYAPSGELEYQLVRADPEWLGTRVGFVLQEDKGATQVRFYHTGWPTPSQHYRTSSFCWAMYLRILRRYLEHGEVVPYERRLEV
jgi:uncharacterized protein YndB with AHSA1/START domain